MNDIGIFNKQFLQRLKKTLDQKCVGGMSITKEELATELEFPEEMAKSLTSAISSLVSSGGIDGYEVRRAPYGGFGKIGERPPPGTIKRTSKADRFEPWFVDAVSNALEELTANQEYVRRIDVARAIGMPGSDTEASISLAIASGRVKGYESQRGAGHGIRRIPLVKAETKAEVKPEAKVEVDEPAVEETAEESKSIFKPRKSKARVAKEKAARRAA